MARMKFMMDAHRCIACDACDVACKAENGVPMGMFRRRVIEVNEGESGEFSISIACMHCSNAPCVSVCPVNALSKREDGIVALSKDVCIGCGYCFFACPFGAPQFPKGDPFGARGVMDKCTYCAGGTDAMAFSEKEKRVYGSNRIAEGKLPKCAEICSTKALLAGDAAEISNIFRERVGRRGAGAGAWGWRVAYPEAE